MPLSSLAGRYPGSLNLKESLSRINSTNLYDTGGQPGATVPNPYLPRTRTTAPVVTARPTPAAVTSDPYAKMAAGFTSATSPQTGPVGSVGNAIANAPTATAGFPQGGTQPMSGWAKGMGYTPADIMGMNQMPARYLYDILGNRGMDPTGGLFYMMEPLAEVMMPMYEAMVGGGRDITQGFEANEIANFMGQMFGEMMTPGGRGFDVSETFQKLLNPGGENSILNSYLNTGTPEEQVENFRRYAMMLGQLSGSPMYQQALSNRLSERGYDYLNAFQGGQQPTNTYGQYVRNPGF